MLRASQQLSVDHFVADGVPDEAGRRLDFQLAVDGPASTIHCPSSTELT
jgi:hypothetical protein